MRSPPEPPVPPACSIGLDREGAGKAPLTDTQSTQKTNQVRPIGSRSVWAGLLGHLSSGPEADSWECPSSIAVGSDAALERWPDQGELNYMVIHWML